MKQLTSAYRVSSDERLKLQPVLSLSEVGAILGINKQTVHYHEQNALRKLRKKLRQYESEKAT